MVLRRFKLCSVGLGVMQSWEEAAWKRHLIDVDDAALGAVEVVVALLQQLLQDGLHVLAHVSRLQPPAKIRQQARKRDSFSHLVAEAHALP